MVDLQEKADIILKKWANIIVENVKAKWANLEVSFNEHGYKTIEFNTEKTLNYVEAVFHANGMQAWIFEYGSGSEMITDPSINPQVQDYLGSNMYNPQRKAQGNAFVGKAKGETVYTVSSTEPYGTRVSTGKLNGRNLELIHVLPPYTPSEPMLVINEEIKATLPLIKKDIVKMCEEEIQKELQNRLLRELTI